MSLTDRRLLTDRQLLIDGRKRQPLPSSDRREFKNPRRKQPKPDAVASKSQPPADSKTCQLEEFDAFRWAFSLPTGCHG
jgi:hypothetical protein